MGVILTLGLLAQNPNFSQIVIKENYDKESNKIKVISLSAGQRLEHN